MAKVILSGRRPKVCGGRWISDAAGKECACGEAGPQECPERVTFIMGASVVYMTEREFLEQTEYCSIQFPAFTLSLEEIGSRRYRPECDDQSIERIARRVVGQKYTRVNIDGRQGWATDTFIDTFGLNEPPPFVFRLRCAEDGASLAWELTIDTVGDRRVQYDDGGVDSGIWLGRITIEYVQGEAADLYRPARVRVTDDLTNPAFPLLGGVLRTFETEESETPPARIAENFGDFSCSPGTPITYAPCCTDPARPPIVVDVSTHVPGFPNTVRFGPELYKPDGTPADGLQAVGDFVNEFCPTIPTYPVMAPCTGGGTIVADDTDRVGLVACEYQGELHYDTGTRSFEAPVQVVWTNQSCNPGDAPVFDLCGPPPPIAVEGGYFVQRIRPDNIASDAEYASIVFVFRDPADPDCLERWRCTFQRSQSDEVPYLWTRSGSEASACADPDKIIRLCTRLDGIETDRPIGPSDPLSPAGLGLGDVVAGAIHAGSFGIVRPCGSCRRRQAVLNRWGRAFVRSVRRAMLRR